MLVSVTAWLVWSPSVGEVTRTFFYSNHDQSYKLVTSDSVT